MAEERRGGGLRSGERGRECGKEAAARAALKGGRGELVAAARLWRALKAKFFGNIPATLVYCAAAPPVPPSGRTCMSIACVSLGLGYVPLHRPGSTKTQLSGESTSLKRGLAAPVNTC